MTHRLIPIAAGLAMMVCAAPAAAQTPSDAEIAHIAYTAGNLDIAAAKLALTKTQNVKVREFAATMVRDHEAVNVKALEVVKALDVTPKDNSTSKALSEAANATLERLNGLSGAAFDAAYVDNEVAFHRTVNGALKETLIPSASNAQLKSLLETGLTLFREHQTHAEHLAAALK
jgi:putative membrane protein